MQKVLIAYKDRKIVLALKESPIIVDDDDSTILWAELNKFLEADKYFKLKLIDFFPILEYHDKDFKQTVEISPSSSMPPLTTELILKFCRLRSPVKLTGNQVPFPSLDVSSPMLDAHDQEKEQAADIEFDPLSDEDEGQINDHQGAGLIDGSVEVLSIEDVELPVISGRTQKEAREPRFLIKTVPLPKFTRDVEIALQDPSFSIKNKKYHSFVRQATDHLRISFQDPTPKEFSYFCQALMAKYNFMLQSEGPARFDDYTLLKKTMMNRNRNQNYLDRISAVATKKVKKTSIPANAAVFTVGASTSSAHEDNILIDEVRDSHQEEENELESVAKQLDSAFSDVWDADEFAAKAMSKNLNKEEALALLSIFPDERRTHVKMIFKSITQVYTAWPAFQSFEVITNELLLLEEADFEEVKLKFENVVVKLAKELDYDDLELTENVKLKVLASLELKLHPKIAKDSARSIRVEDMNESNIGRAVMPHEVPAIYPTTATYISDQGNQIMSCFLVAEHEVVCKHTAKSCFEVVLLLLSAFYTFDLNFHKDNLKFLEFWDFFLFGKSTSSVAKVLSALKKKILSQI